MHEDCPLVLDEVSVKINALVDIRFSSSDQSTFFFFFPQLVKSSMTSLTVANHKTTFLFSRPIGREKAACQSQVRAYGEKIG